MSNDIFKIGWPELGLLSLLGFAASVGIVKGMAIFGGSIGLGYSHPTFQSTPEGTNWVVLIAMALFLFIGSVLLKAGWDKHQAPISRR